MNPQPWSHLPNAAHIDRILASVKEHPEVWDAAWDAARYAARNAIMDAARDAARYAARNAIMDAARDATRVAARDAIIDAAGNSAWYAARHAARYAIMALIAWDDCAHYLDLSSAKLEIWAKLSEKPECLLLLPAVKAFEKIDEMELTA